MTAEFASDTANGLTLSYNSGPVIPLSYSGQETFSFNQARFTFIRDGGRVTKVRVDIVGSYTVAIRSTASAQGSVPP